MSAPGAPVRVMSSYPYRAHAFASDVHLHVHLTETVFPSIRGAAPLFAPRSNPLLVPSMIGSVQKQFDLVTCQPKKKKSRQQKTKKSAAGSS